MPRTDKSNVEVPQVSSQVFYASILEAIDNLSDMVLSLQDQVLDFQDRVVHLCDETAEIKSDLTALLNEQK